LFSLNGERILIFEFGIGPWFVRFFFRSVVPIFRTLIFHYKYSVLLLGRGGFCTDIRIERTIVYRKKRFYKVADRELIFEQKALSNSIQKDLSFILVLFLLSRIAGARRSSRNLVVVLESCFSAIVLRSLPVKR